MPFRSLLITATAAGALAMAAPAFALPPRNDNYLSSLPIDPAVASSDTGFTDNTDTTEATTQSDLFNPSRDGQPLGGAGPENLACGATTFGKTVWYDLHPPANGGVEITTAGFDAVVTMYEWNKQTARITRNVRCHDRSGLTEDMIVPTVRKGHAYTIQVGGVAGPGGAIAGGPLEFHVDYFPDTDNDGFLDGEGDKCPTTPGPRAFGGCPPELNISPSLNFDSTANGITINRLIVGRVPRGAKVTATCGGCRAQKVTARRSTVELRRIEGRSVRAGSKVRVRVTLGRSGKGKYRFGATGKLITWPVRRGGIGLKKEQCLHEGTGRIQKCR
jgi:hypothetical protein